MNSTKGFYERQLACKFKELATKEQQLNIELDDVRKKKLFDGCEQILLDIEEISKKLEAANTKEETTTVNITGLRTVLRKIDFQEARDIAENLYSQFKSQELGAAILILQKTDKQMGEYCLDEMLTEIFKRDIPTQNVFSPERHQGNYRTYRVGADDVHERTALGFLRKIAENDNILISDDPQKINHDFRQSFCKTLCSGDRVLFLVKDFHLSTDPQGFAEFVTWFLKDFWKALLEDVEQTVLPEKHPIKIIAVLTSTSTINEDCLNNIRLRNTVEFDSCQPIDIPLPDWKKEDIQKWLMEYQSMTKTESEKKVSSIYEGSDGTPQAICLKLESMAHGRQI